MHPILRSIRAAAGVAAVSLSLLAASCGGGGNDATTTIEAGSAIVRTPGEGWTEIAGPTTSFENGTEIEARSGGATVSVTLADGASVRMILVPGTRVRRRSDAAFDVIVGRADIGVSNLTDRLIVFHAGTFAEVRGPQPGVEFSMDTDGPRAAIHVSVGSLLAHATGELGKGSQYATLGPDEQALVEGGERPVKTGPDDDRTPFLAPSIEVDSVENARAGESIVLLVTVRPGASGTFRQKLHPEGGSFSLDSKGGWIAGSGSDVTTLEGEPVQEIAATSDAPGRYRVTFEGSVAKPGSYQAVVLYNSFQRKTDRTQWLGSASAPPVELTVDEE